MASNSSAPPSPHTNNVDLANHANHTNHENHTNNASPNHLNTTADSLEAHSVKVLPNVKCAGNTASALQKSFAEMLKEPNCLEEATNYLYQSLLDDAATGVYLEVYHLLKTGNLPALEGVPEENAETLNCISDLPNYDIFGISTGNKPKVCVCPICSRPVAAVRFAPHLAKCMGMGRNSSRIASRRLANKDTGTSSSSTSSYHQVNAGGTDDEDDVDWSSEKRRRKTNPNARNNGAKKNNGKSF